MNRTRGVSKRCVCHAEGNAEMEKIKSAPVYSPLWKKLYTLVNRFVREEPWELFENPDTFIVRSPRDGQMYLCCILGNAGEEFGLNAFRGARGMRNFEKIASHDPNKPLDRGFKFELDMLSVSLSPRDFMEDKDLKILKKLMFSFPGGKWPLVRSYRPHYLSWFLTELEIEDLCDCLEQSLELLDMGDKALDDIRNAAPGEMLVRCVENSSWVSRKLSVHYSAKEDVPEVVLDDVTLQRLRNLPAEGLQEEIDLIHMAGAIMNHTPPYHGLVLVGINEHQHAEEYGLFPPFHNFFQEAIESLARTFLSRGMKPRTVLLREGSPFADFFEKIAEKVDIQFEKSDDLPYISDFVQGMDKAMTYGSFPEDDM